MPTVLQKFFLIVAGSSLTALGLVGLVVPIMPGVLFLAGAVVCFSVVSAGFRDNVGVHLFRQPRYRLARRRWNAGAGLPLPQRLRLAFWTGLGALTPGPQPNKD